eukprot:SM000155S01670  [mRNA]  locus=s155:308468:309583:+ [translate_table: standard]
MGQSREVDLGGGRAVVVRESDDVVADGDGAARTGAWVWDCALVLAHWLAAWPPGSLAGKRVVELGAGTGLPGLVAAALGAEVVVTDRPALLPGLERNVAINELGALARTAPLEWGGDCSSLLPPVDYILASDVLYDVEAVPSLCRTIRDLSDGRTRLLLAYELRWQTTECFQVMYAHGLRWSKVPNEELHPQWRSEDIGIFKVQVEAS